MYSWHILTLVTFKVLSFSCITTIKTFFPLLKTVCELVSFLKIFNLFIFRERKGGRKTGRERYIDQLPLVLPQLGTWPKTQACAPSRSWTSNPLVNRLAVHWATPAGAKFIHQFWCLLVLLPFFMSPLPHQQNISLWGLFYIQGNKKMST